MNDKEKGQVTSEIKKNYAAIAETIESETMSESYSVIGRDGHDFRMRHALKKIEEQRSFMRQKDMKKDKLEISGTVQTSLQKEKKLKKDETKEIQQENWLEHKENSEQELLISQHLLMKSSNHLFKLMKGLVRNDQDTSIQLYDVDRVMASVACAKQITEMAKAAWTIEQVIKNTE